MEALTNKVLRFISDSRFEDLPDKVIHQAKRCLLDTLGALLAGSDTPVVRMMNSFATKYLRGNEATILVSGERVSPVGAALANGYACNALDIDDGYRMIKGHPGGCVLPVLLAASESAVHPKGTDFLTALVIGYEVAIRAGLIRHALYQTYHSSGSWGAVGGAAAAGRVLGLDQSTLREAMGVAEYHAPIAPMMKGVEKPSMVKDSIGWGTMVAMASVLMAQEGFTGIEPLFSESPDTKWIEGLGNEYLMLNLYFKPYAVCRWSQPAVVGVLKVVKQNNLRPQSISRIRIRTFEAAAALSCDHPKNTEEAQYNLAYGLACAVLKGKVGPQEVTPPAIYDPQILAFMDKIEPVEDQEIQKTFPAKRQARVEIKTTDGRVFESGVVDAPWGVSANRPTDQDLIEKFEMVTGPVLGKIRSQELQDMIWNLEREPKAALLVELAKVKES
jgi:2-methylcitrate dehydratase PrpD